MIIRTAYQNACLRHTQILYQFKVFFACSDPACYFWKFVSALHTFVYSVTILLTVQEKLALTNLTIRTSKFMKIVINVYDLLSTVRCS